MFDRGEVALLGGVKVGGAECVGLLLGEGLSGVRKFQSFYGNYPRR